MINVVSDMSFKKLDVKGLFNLLRTGVLGFVI